MSLEDGQTGCPYLFEPVEDESPERRKIGGK